MRRLLILLLILLIGGGWYFWTKNTTSPTIRILSQKPGIPTPSPIKHVEKSIFVPYWTLDGQKIPEEYKQVVYFGITVNEKGVDTSDIGYKNVAKFSKSVDSSQKTLLTVRMLDRDTNEKILQSPELQKHVIQDALTVATQQHFDGVVLDLEQNAIAFDSVVKGITQFSTSFAKAAKAYNLSFYQAIYGDAFYRLRPYDVSSISKATDGIFIMAYDLHKAGADAGPNFPLQSTDEYTFGMMLTDFLKKVPAEKLSVILGMYGYSWPVDSKGQTLATADALSWREIQQHIYPTCAYINCSVQESSKTATKVTYSDNGKNYILFFDNPTMLQKKEDLLKEKRISHISYWAYSYF